MCQHQTWEVSGMIYYHDISLYIVHAPLHSYPTLCTETTVIFLCASAEYNETYVLRYFCFWWNLRRLCYNCSVIVIVGWFGRSAEPHRRGQCSAMIGYAAFSVRRITFRVWYYHQDLQQRSLNVRYDFSIISVATLEVLQIKLFVGSNDSSALPEDTVFISLWSGGK